MFNDCTVQIKLEYGSCNGKVFDVKILHESDETSLLPLSNIAVFEKQITLPTKLKIIASGKNQNQDTVVDDDGNILKDLFVKISSISLDGFMLNEIYLYHKINIVTEDKQIFTTNYIGFNGEVDIIFNEENVLSQLLVCNS